MAGSRSHRAVRFDAGELQSLEFSMVLPGSATPGVSQVSDHLKEDVASSSSATSSRPVKPRRRSAQRTQGFPDSHYLDNLPPHNYSR